MLQYSWQVIGHERQRAQFERDLLTENIAHAYLLAGPQNTGKWLIAQTFAAILQCPHSYCRTCSTCLAIAHNTHLDTIALTDDTGETLKMDQIRSILAEISMRPQSAYKIILLQNIERMEKETGNALLKTLEEPPPRTLFIFTTALLEDTLPTIRSRARVVKFSLVPEEILQKALDERFPEVDAQLKQKATTFALGRPGRALSLLAESDRLLLLQNLYNDISAFLASRSLTRILPMMREAAEDRTKSHLFLDIFEHVLRDTLLADVTAAPRILPTIDQIQRARGLINGNVSPKLVLDTLVTAAL